ncbi:unnamed protein product, partial [marine sediment metagenome]
MLVIGLDTETTDLDPKKGARIIEIAMITVEIKKEDDDKFSMKAVDKYTRRVNPRCEINPKAEAVHGISLSSLASEPYFEDIADAVSKRIERADWMVAHNADFDVEFIVSELTKVSRPIPDTQVFCTMEQGTWATSTGKLPSLQELCFACGVMYDPTKAHAATYDVLVMLSSLKAGIERGHFKF